MSDLSMRNVLVLAIIGLVSGAIGGILVTQLHTPPAKTGKLLSDKELTQDDWLLGAPDDTERFRRLQQQFIGFAQPMLEISERFRRIYESLGRSNYERAAYHWTKIQQALTNAIMRRPARAANAHVFFLDSNYQRLLTEFESRDPARAWGAFEEAKGICQGCHLAEQAGFVNNQALFELSAPAHYGHASIKQ